MHVSIISSIFKHKNIFIFFDWKLYANFKYVTCLNFTNYYNFRILSLCNNIIHYKIIHNFYFCKI